MEWAKPGLRTCPASFEALLRKAPQDEEGLWMALRNFLILRCFAQRSLEGRTTLIRAL